MVTPGSTAPDSSLTVPTITPVMTCASAELSISHNPSGKRIRVTLGLMRSIPYFPELIAWREDEEQVSVGKD